MTAAIHKAEHCLDQAIKAWEEVEKAEAAILNSEDDHFIEHDRLIASRGVAIAHMHVLLLRLCCGRTDMKTDSKKELERLQLETNK